MFNIAVYRNKNSCYTLGSSNQVLTLASKYKVDLVRVTDWFNEGHSLVLQGTGFTFN